MAANVALRPGMVKRGNWCHKNSPAAAILLCALPTPFLIGHRIRIATDRPVGVKAIRARCLEKQRA